MGTDGLDVGHDDVVAVYDDLGIAEELAIAEQLEATGGRVLGYLETRLS